MKFSSVTVTNKKFRMKKLLAFSLFIVIFAAAYSAPFSHEDVINQLLSIREDLLASKHTSQQGMDSTLPLPSHPSPPYGSPFYGNDQYERKFNRDVIPKQREAALVSHTEERNQLFSKILGLVSDYIHLRNELMPGPSIPKDSHNRRGDGWTTAKMSEANKLPLGEDRSRVQDYIKTRNETWENEQANQLIRNLFMCLTNSTLNYVESLKKGKIFGIVHETILKSIQKLIGKTDFTSYYKTFLDIVNSVIHGDSLVGKEQALDFDFFKKIMRDMFREYADAAPKGSLENMLNILKVVLHRDGKLSAEDRASFINAINYFIDEKIEGNEKKKAIKDAVNNILPALFKIINGEDLNMSQDDRNHLLKSVVTMLASFNGGLATNNSRLFYLINQFLSKNPSNEDLHTKSQCLIAFTLRRVLESLLKIFDSEELGTSELGLMKCGIEGVKGGFRFLLAYVPKDLNNVGGCEGFDMNVGFQGAAQRKMVMKINTRSFAPSRVNWKRPIY